jgi:hypothetical protein
VSFAVFSAPPHRGNARDVSAPRELIFVARIRAPPFVCVVERDVTRPCDARAIGVVITVVIIVVIVVHSHRCD